MMEGVRFFLLIFFYCNILKQLKFKELYLIVWFYVLQYLHSDFELFMCKVLRLRIFNYKVMIF
jgi:hypothetical protein